MKVFSDRYAAGRELAAKLSAFSNRKDVLVLALPRGGVPVAYEVAKALRVQFDILVVRKLGLPRQPELAIGAIASGGARVLNDRVVRGLGIAPEVIERVADEEARELRRRERAYRGDRPPIDVQGKTVILVDDGMATGTTMRVAVDALRQLDPEHVVVAVPTGAHEACEALTTEADEVVCLDIPSPYVAVGRWFDDFSQTTDAEVRELLEPENNPHSVA